MTSPRLLGKDADPRSPVSLFLPSGLPVGEVSPIPASPGALGLVRVSLM